MSSVYNVITDRILSSLESGVIPWRKPWRSGMPANLLTRREYKGVNRLLLASTSFESNLWLTFNQCRGLGGSVRKGSKGMPIIFWQVRDKEARDGKVKREFTLRFFTVFNVAQTERIEIPPTPMRTFDPIARCEAIVAGYQGAPEIEHGGDQAYYSPLKDRIQMPARESFFTPDDYYATLFHEIGHSTGARHRLNRAGITDLAGFTKHDMTAREELIAEISSAFLSADANIAPAILDRSASYIASWLKALRNDPKMVIEASAQAERAVELVLGRKAARVEEQPEAEAA